jgi:hypothetical protein
MKNRFSKKTPFKLDILLELLENQRYNYPFKKSNLFQIVYIVEHIIYDDLIIMVILIS